MIETVSDAPAYRPDGVPVTSMATGKVATPELVSAVRPIEATVPLTGPFTPSVVITAGSPSLIWPTTLASTLASTTSLALTTVIEPAELPEPEPEPEPLSPLPEPPPEPPPPPLAEPPPSSPPPLAEPPPPVICSPTVSPTVATMPSAGAVSVAPASAVFALSSWDWSALTDAWSAVSWALDAPLASSWESRAWSPASAAFACAAWAASVGEFIVARAWPSVTCCPTVASTAVTWPAASKLSVLVDAGSMVPVEDSAWRRVVLAAGTSWYDGPAEAEDQV